MSIFSKYLIVTSRKGLDEIRDQCDDYDKAISCAMEAHNERGLGMVALVDTEYGVVYYPRNVDRVVFFSKDGDEI